MENRLRAVRWPPTRAVLRGDTVEAVAVMRRYLVVANQTLQGAELREELVCRAGNPGYIFCQ
jgi:hypothetical protein